MATGVSARHMRLTCVWHGALVIPQVREETGVETEFVSLVCMRHNTRFVFGKSDMYIVARLRPTSTTIHADPDEIADARWMPVAEFLRNPVRLGRTRCWCCDVSRRVGCALQDVYPLNRRVVEVALAQTTESPRLSLAQEQLNIQYAGFKARFVLYAPTVIGAGDVDAPGSRSCVHDGGVRRTATSGSAGSRAAAPVAPVSDIDAASDSLAETSSGASGGGQAPCRRRGVLVPVLSAAAAVGVVALLLLARSRGGRASAGPQLQRHVLAARL